MPRLLSRIVIVAAACSYLWLPYESFADEPLAVSVCGLLANPGAFNHRLIEVHGSVSRGFEEFTLSDAACSSKNIVWLEFGGRLGSQVVYCCGVPTDLQRATALKVEGIETTIREDELLSTFQRLTIPHEGSSHAVVTLIGRYFSGKPQKFQGGTYWMGYGHMGMATLLVIEQVKSVAEE